MSQNGTCYKCFVPTDSGTNECADCEDKKQQLKLELSQEGLGNGNN